ncbi:membrane protein [Jannaschia pagri]|uniref:Membrane protein n=1 Tax=Jannaschia pagri TaxID=2829797 RepID=A0ABQ4NL01_9RHOB|nr:MULTISPECIES: TIGR02186 family protein [unclassified Jannaschia]GIT91262.1 membrane protein [Jannaschia sp. AI_61]GIT95095.1 membrane protein [Jannaschia sp. AI_62]
MRHLLSALACLICVALPLHAEEVVADLSQDRVSISTSFDGSEILVFGAVKRDAPIPQGASPLAVIITISGPDEVVTVRRKDRRFGIWVNVEGVEVERAPSFYAVASTVPLDRALSETEDQRWNISTGRKLRAVGATEMAENPPAFLEALIRVREADGIYIQAAETVQLRDSTLFSTEIALPAALTEGDYNTRIFLTRDGQVVDSYATSIFVQKVGLERFIYALAHEQPLIYGLLSLAIAIAAGWIASTVFRYLLP